MVRGLVIRPEIHRPIELREFDVLEDYQIAVEGWIEAVDVPSLGITMFVNESGLAHKLRYNARVTSIWWYEVEAVRHHSVLCGTAVVVGMPNDDGEMQDIPQPTLRLLASEEPYAVMTKFADTERWLAHPREYAGYLDAVVWAMIFADPVTTTIEVKVLTFPEFLAIRVEQDGPPKLDGMEGI